MLPSLSSLPSQPEVSSKILPGWLSRCPYLGAKAWVQEAWRGRCTFNRSSTETWVMINQGHRFLFPLLSLGQWGRQEEESVCFSSVCSMCVWVAQSCLTLCNHTDCVYVYIYICVGVYMYIFIYICVCVYVYIFVAVLITQSCLTLFDPMGCSPPGSSLSMGFSRQEYWSSPLAMPFIPGGKRPGSVHEGWRWCLTVAVAAESWQLEDSGAQGWELWQNTGLAALQDMGGSLWMGIQTRVPYTGRWILNY